MEEAQAWGQESDRRRRAMLLPLECGRGAGLAVVLKKSGELILVVETGAKVFADWVDVTGLQSVVQSLIVTIVEALLFSPLPRRHAIAPGPGCYSEYCSSDTCDAIRKCGFKVTVRG
jgi:hypothetical protein